MDLILIITGIALLACSVSDWKTREVPDWLSHGLIFFGIGAACILAVMQQSWQPILFMLGGSIAGLAIGLGMFFGGQWGGGDGKLIIGMGAVLGLWWQHYDLLTFILNLIIVGVLYGLTWSVTLAVKHRKEFWPAFQTALGTKLMLRLRTTIMIVAFISLLLCLFVIPPPLNFIIISVVAIGYVLFYLFVFTKIVEKSVLLHPIDVSKLTEGDWIAKDVRVGKQYICGPKDLGISLEQIALLKKKRIKQVTIKEGIPFVPSFLLAFILHLVAGNWIAAFF